MKVLLINMPWSSCRMGSIQLALLQPSLRAESIPCDTAYLNIELARRIGPRLYETIAHQGFLIGEILFAPHVFPDVSARAALAALDSYLAARWNGPDPDPTAAPFSPWGRRRERAILREVLEAVDHLEAQIAALLEDFEARFAPATYDVVGFTTTFEQNLPSLALARRIKARDPGVRTVFGGANCDADMGVALHQAFPQVIDHVVVGEGEETFPELVAAIRSGTGLETIPGLTYRDGDVRFTGPRSPARHLDAAPTPDFADYLAALAGSALPVEPRLPFEASRGCWWGVKHLCAFCGLNQTRLDYRSKSPGRVRRELMELCSSTGVLALNGVDNILDVRYFRDLLPELAELRDDCDFDLFFEVKANLRRDQIALLREAGVLAVQPGIESFSDHILGLMDKGCTALQNVQTLKWLAEAEIEVIWGIITGIPGERDDDYQQMIEWVQYLEHLPPPAYVIPLELHRFSPFFSRPGDHGIRNPRAAGPYRLAYRLPAELLGRISYVYDFDRDAVGASAGLRAALDRACQGWYAGFHAVHRPLGAQRPKPLTYERGPGFVVIRDTRGGAAREYRLRGEEARVFLLCDAIRPLEAIEAARGRGAHRAVDRLVDDRLMLRDRGDRVLSLAVASSPPAREPGPTRTRRRRQLSELLRRPEEGGGDG